MENSRRDVYFGQDIILIFDNILNPFFGVTFTLDLFGTKHNRHEVRGMLQVVNNLVFFYEIKENNWFIGGL